MDSFGRRAFVATAIVAGVVAALLLAWVGAPTLLMLFSSVLLAVGLRGLSDRLARWTGLGEGWSVAIVTVALCALTGVGTWLLWPTLSRQLVDFSRDVPHTVREYVGDVESTPVGEFLLGWVPAAPSDSGEPASPSMLEAIGRLATSAVNGLMAMLIVPLLALYLAATPRSYVDGLVGLVPIRHRPRARQILDEIGRALWDWLAGQVVAGAVVWGLSSLGLWLLGCPMSLLVGLLAGILNFVPNLGPLLSLVPAFAVALSADVPLWQVFVVYGGVQSLQNFVITPLVEERMVALPPVQLIVAQLVLGAAFGTAGVFTAAPLAVVAMILLQRLYREGILGDAPAEG